ncbi:MAG TPA: SpoIIE family protein phosphatase [Frankiaceae bacterium]|nr:SpoIIE family protein phosphatase [Frankiaceae bacterium]
MADTRATKAADAAHEAFYAALLDDDADKLYEQAPCGYLSTAPDGTIVKANQTFLQLTGYASGDLIGNRTFAQLLSAGGRIYYETHYAPLLQMQGSAREIAFDIVRRDGSRVPVLVNAVLDRTADGTPVVVRAAVFDATQRREYERELLRAKQRAELSEKRAVTLARTLQRTLIPPTPPAIPGLDIAAAYRPAGSGEEVGGDFYDIFQIGDDDWVVALGDVRGKGVEAAVVTALARHSLRAASFQMTSPSRALHAFNDELLAHESDRFATVLLMRLHADASGWSATLSAGGHPLPLLRSPGERPTTFGEPGTVLGLFPEPVLHDATVRLEPGNSLVLYTDGVTEGRRRREFFGEAALEACVARQEGSAQQLVDAILDEVMAFQDDNPSDDIAVVGIRVPR